MAKRRGRLAATRPAGGQRLFAFWRYSSYPFVLGAEVVGFSDDGWVEAAGYGGMRFRPIKIVPVAAGVKIHAALKRLEAEEREAREAHDSAWLARVAELLPELASP